MSYLWDLVTEWSSSTAESSDQEQQDIKPEDFVIAEKPSEDFVMMDRPDVPAEKTEIGPRQSFAANKHERARQVSGLEMHRRLWRPSPSLDNMHLNVVWPSEYLMHASSVDEILAGTFKNRALSYPATQKESSFASQEQMMTLQLHAPKLDLMDLNDMYMDSQTYAAVQKLCLEKNKHHVDSLIKLCMEAYSKTIKVRSNSFDPATLLIHYILGIQQRPLAICNDYGYSNLLRLCYTDNNLSKVSEQIASPVMKEIVPNKSGESSGNSDSSSLSSPRASSSSASQQSPVTTMLHQLHQHLLTDLDQILVSTSPTEPAFEYNTFEYWRMPIPENIDSLPTPSVSEQIASPEMKEIVPNKSGRGRTGNLRRINRKLRTYRSIPSWIKRISFDLFNDVVEGPQYRPTREDNMRELPVHLKRMFALPEPEGIQYRPTREDNIRELPSHFKRMFALPETEKAGIQYRPTREDNMRELPVHLKRMFALPEPEGIQYRPTREDNWRELPSHMKRMFRLPEPEAIQMPSVREDFHERIFALMYFKHMFFTPEPTLFKPRSVLFAPEPMEVLYKPRPVLCFSDELRYEKPTTSMQPPASEDQDCKVAEKNTTERVPKKLLGRLEKSTARALVRWRAGAACKMNRGGLKRLNNVARIQGRSSRFTGGRFSGRINRRAC